MLVVMKWTWLRHTSIPDLCLKCSDMRHKNFYLLSHFSRSSVISHNTMHLSYQFIVHTGWGTSNTLVSFTQNIVVGSLLHHKMLFASNHKFQPGYCFSLVFNRTFSIFTFHSLLAVKEVILHFQLYMRKSSWCSCLGPWATCLPQSKSSNWWNQIWLILRGTHI
jgi:hypothetical protein